MLVAIVLITTVAMTYSTIRSSTVSSQPQIESAIDETNLAIKQILGFTVGYYGSILKSTGNQTYAMQLATAYLQSGLVYTANMHPDWGGSFDVTSSQLYTNWYMNTSYSFGSISINYNLTGLGIHGITYNANCSLTVQVMPSANSQAILSVTKDGTEPLIDLGMSNLLFYSYSANDSSWNQVAPPDEPLAYANGTYQIDIPPGVDVNSYMVQVQDQRGIMVIASSFSAYTINLAWNATTAPTYHFVDNNGSDVDGNGNIGTMSNFAAMQTAPDGSMNTLTEAITTTGVPEKWVSPISNDPTSWTSPSLAYDNNTATSSSTSISAKSWSSYLTLDISALSCHKISYYADTSNSAINQIRIDIYNGTWNNVYTGSYSSDVWTNVTFAETLITKMRFSFYNNHGSKTYNANVYEARFLQTSTPQNCQLDVEAQWTNVNYNATNQWLCIYGGTMAAENIRLDVRSGSTWINLFSDLVTGWNNVSVSQYVNSPTFTIRFTDGTQTNDPSQDSWQIDSAVLSSGGSTGISTSSTIVFELEQSGTMRWLGSNLQQTTVVKPVPPIPVKALHLNETVANVSSEVPFQIEDWASNYQIPLGLTNNASVFTDTNMLVFMASPNVTRVTVWWNGSDTTTQTPYAYNDIYFTGDNPSGGVLTNGILRLNINGGQITSTQGTSTAIAVLMRINGQNSTYGAGTAYVIHHGVVRDIIQQEAEWSGGAPNCPNLYAQIVVTLPANVNYYTYQLRLMFVTSQQSRTITDLCPIRLTVPTGSPLTENGTSGGNPIVSSATGLFYNQSSSQLTHHWSEFISGTKGAGIMLTDTGNQELYAFDSIAGSTTGAISVSNSTGNMIELRPVTMNQVSFTYALDVAWHGAVATFDGTTPIYNYGNNALWTTVECLPIITVGAS